uniref:Chemokine interleukin-8-like domain-containing protein n=1 Tax=Poecilia latipinna TaxID=48699 RepID=A0A3B3TRK2_9TELE
MNYLLNLRCNNFSPAIKKCRCINTIPAVRRALIADVKVYEPNPFCSKREVIVVRKDNKEFLKKSEERGKSLQKKPLIFTS